MAPVGGNADVWHCQESFGRHLGNFQAIEVPRFHVPDDPPDRLTRGLFAVRTEGAFF
jgi:hypothetical protein